MEEGDGRKRGWREKIRGPSSEDEEGRSEGGTKTETHGILVLSIQVYTLSKYFLNTYYMLGN